MYRQKTKECLSNLKNTVFVIVIQTTEDDSMCENRSRRKNDIFIFCLRHFIFEKIMSESLSSILEFDWFQGRQELIIDRITTFNLNGFLNRIHVKISLILIDKFSNLIFSQTKLIYIHRIIFYLLLILI